MELTTFIWGALINRIGFLLNGIIRVTIRDLEGYYNIIGALLIRRRLQANSTGGSWKTRPGQAEDGAHSGGRVELCGTSKQI